jgi:UDP-N-acetylglucosamine 3-dehydrogenase
VRFVADTLTADLTFYANGHGPDHLGRYRQFRGSHRGRRRALRDRKPEPLRTEHELSATRSSARTADIVTMRQGLATVRVAEACLESARTSQTLAL